MPAEGNTIKLLEKFDPGLKHALFSNFSKATEAILELVDNSVSSRIAEKMLIIEISISPRNIMISDYGGHGMNVKELGEFFEWGKIKERKEWDIGAYSQGGKSAIGYLGDGVTLFSSPLGKKVQYKIDDDDLHDYRKFKEYDVQELPADFIEGATKIEIRRVRRTINADALKLLLGDTYRPLINNGEVKISLNGEAIRPAPYALDETFVSEKFSFDDGVSGWVGRLVGKSGIKGGMRCYKKGRLIRDKEYFSKYDAHYKQTLGYLFGEVYLDNAPVTTNKTDFDRDSFIWKSITEEIFSILKPHIHDLLGREIREPSEEEKDRVKKTRELCAEIMKKRKKEFGGAYFGNTAGQKSPRQRTEKEEKERSIPTGRKNEPRTPPPENSIGKRKRLNEFMEWELRPMDETVRSVIEKDGKLLVINNLFPGFKEAKGNELYLFETASLQMALPDKDEKMTPQEYLSVFDDLFGYLCTQLPEMKKEFSKRKKK